MCNPPISSLYDEPMKIEGLLRLAAVNINEGHNVLSQRVVGFPQRVVDFVKCFVQRVVEGLCLFLKLEYQVLIGYFHNTL